nr:hypothetical protein [Candidatus Cloacimonadota bacterium]
MSIYEEINLTKLSKRSIKDRKSKVSVNDFAAMKPYSLSSFWENLPKILKVNEMDELLEKCVAAYSKGKPIFVALGGHVIKCGLSPILIDLMQNGIISGFVANGSVVIHDYE